MANVIASFPCLNCKYEGRCEEEQLAQKCPWIIDHVLHSLDQSHNEKGED